MDRFILNRDARVVHDREKVDERCNTDDIRSRGEATLAAVRELLRPSEYATPWSACEWCIPNVAELTAPAPAPEPE